MNLALVSRMAWRDVRSGEMGLLLVALLLLKQNVHSPKDSGFYLWHISQTNFYKHISAEFFRPI